MHLTAPARQRGRLTSASLQHSDVQRSRGVRLLYDLNLFFHQFTDYQVKERHAGPSSGELDTHRRADLPLPLQSDADWGGHTLLSQRGHICWIRDTSWRQFCIWSNIIRSWKLFFKFGEGKVGIVSRNEFGFLYWNSDNKKMEAINLGSRYRTPILPIWVTVIQVGFANCI